MGKISKNNYETIISVMIGVKSSKCWLLGSRLFNLQFIKHVTYCGISLIACNESRKYPYRKVSTGNTTRSSRVLSYLWNKLKSDVTCRSIRLVSDGDFLPVIIIIDHNDIDL